MLVLPVAGLVTTPGESFTTALPSATPAQLARSLTVEPIPPSSPERARRVVGRRASHPHVAGLTGTMSTGRIVCASLPGDSSSMMNKVLAFVDGENLVCRYQAMLEAGRHPKPDVVHVKDSFVWHPGMTTWTIINLVRCAYYTSVVGDTNAVRALESKIAGTVFESRGLGNVVGYARLQPRVHKRGSKQKKTKVVDVDVTIDIMRAALTMPIDGIFLFSGDGDYLSLIREVSRSSKQIHVGAFSSGLALELKNNVEGFLDLDHIFFED
jgi:uncharacterized LabA/DUF88 family protein